MSIVLVVGLDQRTVPLHLFERLTVRPPLLGKALDDLRGRDRVGEAVVLSTCQRTELYLATDRFHGAVQDATSFLSDLGAVGPDEISDKLYVYSDDNAAAHLFAVAAGLRSTVVGESEIIGQVRAAWEAARRHGAAGPVLASAFRHALQAGKRARTESSISRGVASISHAAVDVASAELEGLCQRRACLIGAGRIGTRLALALAKAGAVVAVANRTRFRGAALAERIGGRSVPLSDVRTELQDADILVTSTAAPSILFDLADMESIAADRRGRPLLVIDVAVPRDIDPAAATLPGVTLFDMDHLASAVSRGQQARLQAVQRAESIVGEELQRYRHARLVQEITPAIVDLRAKAETIRQYELDRITIDQEQRQLLDTITKRIVAKLLNEPTARLKASAGTPAATGLTTAVRTLFDL